MSSRCGVDHAAKVPRVVAAAVLGLGMLLAPAAPGASGSAPELAIDGAGRSLAVFVFDLGDATDIPSRADLVLLPDDPARPLPRLLTCDPVSESAPPVELDCAEVIAASRRHDGRWVLDASAAVSAVAPGVVTLGVTGTDATVASKESGTPPILRLAFDGCEP